MRNLLNRKIGNKPAFGSLFILTGSVIIISLWGLPRVLKENYTFIGSVSPDEVLSSSEDEGEESFVVTHLPTPDSVKAIYMTSWVAGTPEWREGIVQLIEETELNAIVIDIKDDTGYVSYEVEDPALKKLGTYQVRIPDIEEFIALLHNKGIYVIGRITVFQDPVMTKLRPEWAVQKASDRSVWKDRKGLSFIDAGAKGHWDYIVALAKDAYNQGFDETNFDYIRFPSDGQMQDIYYPMSETKIVADPDGGKAEVVKNFFAYLDRELRGTGVITSADLFGMTTTNTDDLNIGQILENAMPHFDYIAPMVYPSHYPSGFFGYSNVNAVPYEVVKISMDSAVQRSREFRKEVASSTPDAPFLPRIRPKQFRPWLQDNDYPVSYTPEMVRAQIKATYDSGLDSWMLWDAANTYTKEALKPYWVDAAPAP